MDAAGSDPWVQIVEQPKSKAHRFRYECEGRSAGSIPGEQSTNEKKTYPSIKINGYAGEAVVVISCLTKETPPKPHPHSIVGANCNKGVFTQKFTVSKEPISFPNLGIRCVKKKDVTEALKVREQIRVDPFRTGFAHATQNIDLNVVRLCFQVFLPGSQGKFNRILSPVLSQPIYDKKATAELQINRLSRNSGSARGGDEVFLLCDKVAREDIKVRFAVFNDADDTLIWEDFGIFGGPDVHHQYAIVFRTPGYHHINLRQPVEVMISLVRPSDGEESEPRTFRYLPDEEDAEGITEKRKRKRIAVPSEDIPSVVDHEASDPDTVRQRLRDVSIRQHRKRRDDMGPTLTNLAPVVPVAMQQAAPRVSGVLMDTGPSSGSSTELALEGQIDNNIPSLNSEELNAVANFIMASGTESLEDRLKEVQEG